MKIYSKLKQYYRYRRNWKKFKSRKASGGIYKNVSQQLKFYSQFIKSGDLVFDIGANVGDKVDLFLKLGAKVIAVEPQESCWRVLKRRFNGQDVCVVPKAMSDDEGKVTLFVDKSPTISSISQDWISAVKNSGRFSSHKWSEKIEVKTTTLDALTDKYGKPAFCKIDVEGAEMDVLKGLTKPINAISFEFVSERADVAVECIDYLASIGNPEFNYHLGEAEKFDLPAYVGAEEVKKIVCDMRGKVENFGDIYVRFLDTGSK